MFLKIVGVKRAEKYITGEGIFSYMETVTIAREEYETLKQKAALDENMLLSLIQGLEDIKAGRIKPWKNPTA